MSNIYALLIGINHYQPNTLFKDLRGCVRDIDLVNSYIQTVLNVPQQNIWKLTAPNPEVDTSLEEIRAIEKTPTYRNIVEAFQSVTAAASEGEQVYIHYSGHGGRAKTMYPTIKGEEQSDESIVPTDFAMPGGRYLRDVELAMLLKQMTEKGLVVTIVLDSCHSGGATRGDCDVRGPADDEIDTSPQETESLVASREQLEKNWLMLTKGGASAAQSPWLPASQEYVCFAACRPSERAYEYAVSGQERNGALTYWMIDTLSNNSVPNLDYRALYDRVSAKIQSRFPNQLPMLLGAENRLVFGTDLADKQYTVAVLRCNLAAKAIDLRVGLAQGMRRGAQFAIYPQGTTDFTDPQRKLAIVEVAGLKATECSAKVVPVEDGGLDLAERLAAAGLDEDGLVGAIAVMESTPTALKRRVRLVTDKTVGKGESELPADLAGKQTAALEQVRRAMAGNGWITESDDEQAAHYQVALDATGAYEICIGLPLKNLRPPAMMSDPDAASTVVDRLVHLSKYQSVQSLDNSASRLTAALQVELMQQPDWQQPGDPYNLIPFEDPNAIEITVGSFAFLRIVNHSKADLNVTVLDLEPTWAISQVPILGLPGAFYTMAAGEEQIVPLQFALPSGPDDQPLYQRVKEVIKVFAALGPVDYSGLMLPDLDEPPMALRGGASRGGGDALSRLIGAVSAESPTLTRAVAVVPDPNQDWATRQIHFTLVQS